jgi:hypothetical protein
MSLSPEHAHSTIGERRDRCCAPQSAYQVRSCDFSTTLSVGYQLVLDGLPTSRLEILGVVGPNGSEDLVTQAVGESVATERG